MTEEVWRPVAGTEWRYEVSDAGRVRSWLKRGDWRGTKASEPRLLKPGVDKKGKLYVYLGRGDCRQVHHLVLEAFVGPRPPGQEGCHKNDIPADNRAENLEWGTSKHNREQSRLNGGMCVGSKHPNSKLTEEVVREMRRLRDSGVSTVELGRMFGVHQVTASQATRKDTWVHV